MDKRVKARLAAFQRAQRRSAMYHVPRLSGHEKAIREHVARGFTLADLRKAVARAELLDQRNRIDVLDQLAAYDQELGI